MYVWKINMNLKIKELTVHFYIMLQIILNLTYMLNCQIHPGLLSFFVPLNRVFHKPFLLSEFQRIGLGMSTNLLSNPVKNHVI